MGGIFESLSAGLVMPLQPSVYSLDDAKNKSEATRPTVSPRKLVAGQQSRLVVVDVKTGTSSVVFVSEDKLFEAPNWSPVDNSLFLNAEGHLWNFDLDSKQIHKITFDNLPKINNDHLINKTGDKVYLSANDGQIYVGSPQGGKVALATDNSDQRRLHFLHGVSSEGNEIAFVSLTKNAEGERVANLYTRNLLNGEEKQITSGLKPSDGPEYSSDDQWIYFNTEIFSESPGHSQLAKISRSGSKSFQLTSDERVNWFPHISPDSNFITYLSYEPNTLGHPANRVVEIRLVEKEDFKNPKVVATILGGQGSLNVNSWSPDSTKFAYIDYPLATTTEHDIS